MEAAAGIHVTPQHCGFSRRPARHVPRCADPPCPPLVALAALRRARPSRLAAPRAVGAGQRAARHRLVGRGTADPGPGSRIRRATRCTSCATTATCSTTRWSTAGCATSATARRGLRRAQPRSPSPSSCCKRPPDQRLRHAGRLRRRQRRPVLAAEREDEVAGVLSRTRSRTSPSGTCCARSSARRRTRSRSCWRTLGAIVAAQARAAASSTATAIAANAMQAAVTSAAGARGAAADRLHPQQRIRGRPRRHPDPGPQRLRRRRHGRFLRAHGPPRCAATPAATGRRTTCRPIRSPPPASARPRPAPSR